MPLEPYKASIIGEDGQVAETNSKKVSNPVEFWLDDAERIVPFEQVAESLAQYLVDSSFRRQWDERTPIEDRDWYLRRDAGLRAYALHEARVRLRPFARRGVLKGGDYMEAVVASGMNLRRPGDMFDKRFAEFLEHGRRKEGPKFMTRLRKRRKRMADGSSVACPAQRIKFFALLFDRHLVPLEFCSDNVAADAINQAAADMGGTTLGYDENSVCQAMNVRQWRRTLGLRSKDPMIVWSRRGKHEDYAFDHPAAKIHGLAWRPQASS